MPDYPANFILFSWKGRAFSDPSLQRDIDRALRWLRRGEESPPPDGLTESFSSFWFPSIVKHELYSGLTWRDFVVAQAEELVDYTLSADDPQVTGWLNVMVEETGDEIVYDILGAKEGLVDLVAEVATVAPLFEKRFVKWQPPWDTVLGGDLKGMDAMWEQKRMSEALNALERGELQEARRIAEEHLSRRSVIISVPSGWRFHAVENVAKGAEPDDSRRGRAVNATVLFESPAWFWMQFYSELPIRKPGRPKGSTLIPDAQFLKAYGECRITRKTQEQLAEQLAVDVKTIPNTLKRLGLPWPP